jgi:hypothetical protein
MYVANSIYSNALIYAFLRTCYRKLLLETTGIKIHRQRNKKEASIYIQMIVHYKQCCHSFHSLSYDRSIESSKASSPQNAI